ncbi:hypothetical protein P7F88_00305 [Vibrio hannami]|uniref:hypothetical protein n=1 Tax=Vibrio hannami TaxID=2717094 RepID=UPI00240FB215|nr:hypothetical protein [Vibrio hannami]MDG3084617.1 hypothetical protein [Vibrio hannami]
MSSRFLELAWNYKTVTAEEKLLLVALADLADRKGHFSTTYTELSQMMSVSNSLIANCLQKQTQRGGTINIQTSHSEGTISGQLLLERLNTREDISREEQQNLATMTNYYSGSNQQAAPKQSKARLNRSQFAYQKPLRANKNEKMINIIEITPNEIPSWAETTMYTNGVRGQTEIWKSFVEDVQNTGEQLFPQSMLNDRLTQKIFHFKNDAFKTSRTSQPMVKQSSRDEYEEKLKNLYQQSKCDWDD